MNIGHLLKRARHTVHNQRGVTLMELIAVIALITLIFGGIVALLTSMYGSYEQTNEAAQNGRQATMIINQLAQDIRKSVAPSEFGEEAVVIDEENQKIIIVTEKEGRAAPQEVEYRYEGGKIVYFAQDQMELELAPSGKLAVRPLDESECETGTCYEINIVVGDGKGQATMTTKVARYDWGEDFE